MATAREGHKPALGAMMSGAFLLALAIGGVLALLYFWNQLLKPDELGTLSLPLVALIGGVAATFNPCGLPVLPGFLTFMGASGEDTGVRRRAELSVSAAARGVRPPGDRPFAAATSSGAASSWWVWVERGHSWPRSRSSQRASAVFFWGCRRSSSLPPPWACWSSSCRFWAQRPARRSPFLFASGEDVSRLPAEP